MAGRPSKETVDYFPHDAVGGKTLFILQNRFGNDGYAVWFKLLALLCRTPGHAYYCSKPTDWQFLVAEMALSVVETQTIMDCLAELEAIDPELWKEKIVWSQNLVNRLAPVYQNRKGSLPIKPNNNAISMPINPISALDNSEKGNAGVISTTNNRHSVLKRTKGSKVNNTVIPDFVDKELWTAFLEMRTKLRKPATLKAQELLLKDLERFHAAGEDANEVLKQSIKNSWLGLFTTKDRKGGASGINQGNPRALIQRNSYTRSEDYDRTH